MQINTMASKLVAAISLLFLLAGCAERRIHILDHEGKIVGECVAGYDWHLYGLQDSIDYMLFQCAKSSIEQGLTVSDKSLLDRDFTLPDPPAGAAWNKKLAMAHFRKGTLSEQKLGYILAAIEYDYSLKVWAAEDQLAEGTITQTEFDKIQEEAEAVWLGK